MTIINRLNLTQDEENCILFFLQDARGLAQLKNKEQWNPVIDTILQKYLRTKVFVTSLKLNTFKQCKLDQLTYNY
jgi:hypothetical protein